MPKRLMRLSIIAFGLIAILVFFGQGKTIAGFFQNPSHGSIEQMPMEGSDIAQLLQMNAWKWKVRLPNDAKGAVYWVEDWRKGAVKPIVRELGSGLAWPRESQFIMMMKIPSERDPVWIRIGDGGGTSKAMSEYLPAKDSGIQSMSAVENETITTDRDVTLLGISQTDSGFSSGGYKNSDRKHNRIIIYKMRFTKNKDSASPYWKNGAIALRYSSNP